MPLDFKSPSDVADEYLTNLKLLKPGVNTAQQDSDWFIRSQVVGGVVAGAYADGRRVADDAFPQLARTDALSRHLFVYFNRDFNPATKSDGLVLVKGPGTILTGTPFVYQPNGNSYVSTADVTVGATGQVHIQSLDSGQAQNLLPGTVLSLSSPPPGIANSATALFPGIANGTEPESNESAAQTILDRIRAPISGGTESDYKQWARAADAAVTSASVKRYLYGLGTVGVFVTAGTADIDTAVDAGQPIVRIPSQALIDIVQAYIDALKPLTDCATVLPPNEVSQDVTIRVKYASGLSGSTILSGQTLTLNELVAREIGRSLYKLPTGGRKLNGVSYVLLSEIEQQVDSALSDEAIITGSVAKVIDDRHIDDLAATSINRLLAYNEIIKPGTILVVEV